jgi:hypothetical protein
VKGSVEIGAGERNGERQAEACLVQLIDGDDGERSWLGLLGSPRWVGVGPIHLTLLGAGVYHSGVAGSKADSISRLSAR